MIDDVEGVGSDSFPVPEEQQIPPIEAEQLEGADDEPETGGNGTGEGDEESEAEGKTEAEPERKKNPVQERIDKMYAEKKEAEKQADYWRGVAEGRNKPAEPADQQPGGDAAPDPNDETKYPFGEDDPQYMRDSLRFEMRQELAQERQRQQVEDAVVKLETNYSQRLEAVKEELPDYDEKVTKAAASGQWPCPPIVALAIKDSEVGPKVAYHLATNRDEAIRIANLSPIEQAMAFGRLEAKFLGAPAPQPKIATDAPEPAQARTKGGQFAAPTGLDDRLSQEEWLKRRNAQLRV